jgi:hypothetical protein
MRLELQLRFKWAQRQLQQELVSVHSFPIKSDLIDSRFLGFSESESKYERGLKRLRFDYVHCERLLDVIAMDKQRPHSQLRLTLGN